MLILKYFYDLSLNLFLQGIQGPKPIGPEPSGSVLVLGPDRDQGQVNK